MHYNKARGKISDMSILYEKFRTTKQERIRLACAMEAFFQEHESSTEKELEDYWLYLKKRIRPAMEILIKSEDTIKMEKLEKQGWFGRQELEQFIFLAREQQKLESLVWLMRLKDRKYGYEERKLII